MTSLAEAEAEHRAQHEALNGLASSLAPDASPEDVYSAYMAAAKSKLAESSKEEVYASCGPLKQLRHLMAKATDMPSGGDGGPSGGSVDRDLDDEGFAMTQSSISLKCPLLQIDMEESGELRPMRTPCGHVFSYSGLKSTCERKKKVKCPMMGCEAIYTMAELTEAKDVVQQIRRAARE